MKPKYGLKKMPKTTPLECYKQHYTQTTRMILARCSNDADKLMQSHELIEKALESELERVRESMRELINRNGWNK